MEKINMWERDFRVNSIIRRDKTLNIFFSQFSLDNKLQA